MAIERSKAQVFEEFHAKVEDVKLVDDQMREDGKQWHIFMKPLDVKIEGKTGLMHEWLRVTDKTTETSVPEGSVIDRYLAELEDCLPAAKEASTIEDALMSMKGKVFRFKKKKLGRSFEKFEAKGYWTPTKLITEEEAKKLKPK